MQYVLYHARQEGGSDFYGTGFYTSYMGIHFLLATGHGFLTTKDGGQVLVLQDVENEIRPNCKEAKYLFSTWDFKSTVSLPADVVLANCEDPALIFIQVGRGGIDSPQTHVVWGSVCILHCTN